MNQLTISQQYLLCVLNEKGKLPSFSTEIPVCLLAGSLIDLILAQCVAVGKDKKLAVTGELTEDNRHLSSLYIFIRESKPMKVEKLASEYAFSLSDKRLKLLIKDVGMSLKALGCASLESGGLTGNAPRFIPDKRAVDNVIQNIRAELLEDGAVSDEIVALVSLMEKSSQIKKYFSKYERDQLKARLKEIQSAESSKLVKEMVDYINTMFVIIASTSGAH